MRAFADVTGDAYNDQLTSHGALLTQVAEAMAAFQLELEQKAGLGISSLWEVL